MFGLGLGRLGLEGGVRSLDSRILALGPKFWGVPSTTLNFQNSAGTTPMSAVGTVADQPVGKIVDKSGLGNDATQATAPARALLSGRVNLLTATETPSDTAIWQFYGAASLTEGISDPDGGASAIQIDMPSSGAGVKVLGPAGVAGVYYAPQIWIRADADGTIRCLDGTGTSWDATLNVTTAWQLVETPAAVSTGTGGSPMEFAIYRNSAGQLSKVYIWHPQLEKGTAHSAYQRATSDSDYDASVAPLIHDYDSVDDLHTITFPTSLGTDCTIIKANRYAAPTITTAQTIGTSHTLNADNAGMLIFDRALTAAETTLVTSWANRQGGV